MIARHLNGGADKMADTFAEPTTETCNTCNTCNTDFMSAVFQVLPDLAQSMFVTFPGDPRTVKASAWYARPWQAGSVTPDGANNLFAMGSYYPGGDGQVRRKKTHFAALHAVMLDDLGSKVPLERVTLPLSWLIETSPGNHQGGFILSEIIIDAAGADRLMNAIIAAGLCDPGAGGPTARLARLPVGANGKHEPPFAHVLKVWEPTRRYTVEELVNGLEIELPPAGRPKPARKTGADKRTLDTQADDDVHVPRPAENPVIAALKMCSLYKSPLGGGKHDITCPWCHEHTDGLDTGAAYFEPDDLYPTGGFKCLHSHGAQYRIRALLAHLEVNPVAARMKPTIRTTAGELHRVVDAAEKELAGRGRYYQRGGLIVTINTDPGTRESFVVPVSLPALTRALSTVASWERFDGRTEDWVRCDPPSRHAGILFDAQGYDHLLALAGIARQPYLRADGTLATAPGYDTATGMFGVFDARQFSIPANPSAQDARAALSRLIAIVGEFSFAEKFDKAAALALLITAAIRQALPTAPMFLVKAPVMGSGKSFLCKLATALATPALPSPVSFPDSDEECSKLLLSLLLKAPAAIEFDDLSSDLLPFDKLKTAITEESITGRILGLSKDATVSTRTLMMASGNNVSPVRDMTRRVLTINIDPRCASPATRKFERPDLLSEVRANRASYIADALTIVRAWILAGRPRADVPNIASFSAWSDYCRHSLLWLDLPDPATSMFSQMADDPDADSLARLLKALLSEFATAPAMVREIVKKSEQNPDGHLAEVVRDIAEEKGQINRNRLGWWIKRHVGRVVDGMRLMPEKSSRGAAAWKVQVLQVLQVPTGQSEKVAAHRLVKVEV